MDEVGDLVIQPPSIGIVGEPQFPEVLAALVVGLHAISVPAELTSAEGEVIPEYGTGPGIGEDRTRLNLDSHPQGGRQGGGLDQAIASDAPPVLLQEGVVRLQNGDIEAEIPPPGVAGGSVVGDPEEPQAAVMELVSGSPHDDIVAVPHVLVHPVEAPELQIRVVRRAEAAGGLVDVPGHEPLAVGRLRQVQVSTFARGIAEVGLRRGGVVDAEHHLDRLRGRPEDCRSPLHRLGESIEVAPRLEPRVEGVQPVTQVGWAVVVGRARRRAPVEQEQEAIEEPLNGRAVSIEPRHVGHEVLGRPLRLIVDQHAVSEAGLLGRQVTRRRRGHGQQKGTAWA